MSEEAQNKHIHVNAQGDVIFSPHDTYKDHVIVQARPRGYHIQAINKAPSVIASQWMIVQDEGTRELIHRIIRSSEADPLRRTYSIFRHLAVPEAYRDMNRQGYREREMMQQYVDRTAASEELRSDWFTSWELFDTHRDLIGYA